MAMMPEVAHHLSDVWELSAVGGIASTQWWPLLTAIASFFTQLLSSDTPVLKQLIDYLYGVALNMKFARVQIVVWDWPDLGCISKIVVTFYIRNTRYYFYELFTVNVLIVREYLNP